MTVACTNVMERNRRVYKLDEDDMPEVLDLTVAFSVDEIIAGKYCIFASPKVDPSRIPTTPNLLDVWVNNLHEDVHVFKSNDKVGIELGLEQKNVLYII